MSIPPLGISEILTKFIGRAVEGSKSLVRPITAATLSTAETLLGLIKEGIAPDVGRMKESLIRKMEAEADEQAAEAKRKLAEAAEAANRADLPKRRDALAKAELRKRQADAAKTEAEAEAIRVDADTRRLQATAEARTRLIEAISKLQQEGGGAFFNGKNLQGILRLGYSPVETESENPETD